ncbi:hypothetical protein PGB90_004154 [Kerria lacca]
MDSKTIYDKLHKYELYANNVLRSDLKHVCNELDEINCRLAEYVQLRKNITLLQEYEKNNLPYKTMTDIGCNFFLQMHVKDVSTICINVGCGYYVEFSLAEALKFIIMKENILNKNLEVLRQRSANIKAHIKLIFLCYNKVLEKLTLSKE